MDDLLLEHPQLAPERPVVGIAPKLSDAELVTLAVIQALLGYTSEARFLRYADTHLRPWFPYLPSRSGYNKRLRRSSPMLQRIMEYLARTSASWHDDLWLVDSTPVECGRSRGTARRSELVGWAEYGYCASHSRYFWGLRLHLVATASGLPIVWALAPAKADERDTALEMIDHWDLARPGQAIIADKGYRRASFENALNQAGMTLIRPATKSEAPRPGRQFLRPFRQIIESVNQTRRHRTHPPAPTGPHRSPLAQRNHTATRTAPLPDRI